MIFRLRVGVFHFKMPEKRRKRLIDLGKLGTRICDRRRELNMTQSDLAAELRITAQAVSKWERGVAFPNLAFMDELAHTLRMTLDELLLG